MLSGAFGKKMNHVGLAEFERGEAGNSEEFYDHFPEAPLSPDPRLPAPAIQPFNQGLSPHLTAATNINHHTADVSPVISEELRSRSLAPNQSHMATTPPLRHSNVDAAATTSTVNVNSGIQSPSPYQRTKSKTTGKMRSASPAPHQQQQQQQQTDEFYLSSSDEETKDSYGPAQL